MSSTGPYVVVEQPEFVARFLLDPESDTGTADNVDAFVDLPDGASWALSLFSVEEVRRLLGVWNHAGEVAHGSYFWVSDQVIVPESGVPAMVAAIRELVRSGEINSVGVLCENS